MRILVTGSSGFIGFHLCKSLLEKNFKVLGIDSMNNYYDIKLKKARLNILKKYKNFVFKKLKIEDKLEVTRIFESYSPEFVVNLAAQAGVRYSLKNPYAYIDSNLVGFLNLLEISKEIKVNGFIYASSSSVYGGNKKIPFKIHDRVDNPISLYGATKKANELIAKSYSNMFGLHTTGLRFFTVYGPWGRPDMAMFIFTKKILNNKPIPVFNHGKMKRDFTFIEDIISGIESSIEKNYKCEIFNLGNNKSEKLMDIVHLIEKNLNKKAIIEFLPMQPGDVRESFADIDYTKQKLNYNPKTSVEQGIPQFIEWYKEYYEIN